MKFGRGGNVTVRNNQVAFNITGEFTPPTPDFTGEFTGEFGMPDVADLGSDAVLRRVEDHLSSCLNYDYYHSS